MVIGMKRKLMQVVSAVIALALLLPQAAFAAPDTSRVVRVGLYYGSGALVSANLDNVDGKGSGHRFGYFDASNQFVQVGYTEQEQISMLKSTNLYLTSSGTYSETASASDQGVVGCYHLRIPQTLPDFDSAQALAGQLGGFVAWINGSYQVRWGSFTTSDAAQAALPEFQAALAAAGTAQDQIDGASVCWTSKYAVTVVKMKGTQILFQFDGESADLSLGVMPDITGAEDVQTWFKNLKYHGGFRYQRISGGDLTVVNFVPLETYVKGVIPYEMSGSWPLEALKAQAVAARTYVIMNLNGHKSYGFDVCNTTCCQVYYGEGNGSSKYPTATSNQAVDETAGLYLWYEGELVSTNFSSSNGGASESAVNVWGHDYPYLVGKIDPYEATVEDIIPGYHWTVTFTADELTTLLQNKGYGNSRIVNLEIKEYTPTGNVLRIMFTDADGKTYTFAKEKVRTLLSLKSMRYEISGGSQTQTGGYQISGGSGSSTVDSFDGLYAISGGGTVSVLETQKPSAITGTGEISEIAPSGGQTTPSGTFVISGTGYGHNVGMSQWGAYAMAKLGYDYEDILLFYYTGTYISAAG